MRVSAELKSFQTRIGYGFAKTELLLRAVTHASLSSATRPDNQRLEFLGDRVLGLVMAEALLNADAAASEGQLAPRFNALVRKETCAEIARDIGLGDVLKLGRSEMLSGGRKKDALLGDAMEAVIAAVYLDGGFDAARALILRLWGGRIGAVEQDARDPKSSLQEWAQGRTMPPPGLPPPWHSWKSNWTPMARLRSDARPPWRTARFRGVLRSLMRSSRCSAGLRPTRCALRAGAKRLPRIRSSKACWVPIARPWPRGLRPNADSVRVGTGLAKAREVSRLSSLTSDKRREPLR